MRTYSVCLVVFSSVSVRLLVMYGDPLTDLSERGCVTLLGVLLCNSSACCFFIFILLLTIITFVGQKLL